MRFVSRREWGARSSRGVTPAPNMTRGVAVHWLGDGHGPRLHGECAGVMRDVQALHMDTDRLTPGGAADFGYNTAACSHGYVFEGRGPAVRNAANGGTVRHGVDSNAGWASILYLDAKDGPGLSPEGQNAINDAAEWLGVAGGEWLGHLDFVSTECPGSRALAWVRNGHPRAGREESPLPAHGELLMFWHHAAIFLDFHGRISPHGLSPHTVDGLIAAGVRVAGRPGDTAELLRLFGDGLEGPPGDPVEYPVHFLERNGWLGDYLRGVRP